MKYISRGKLKTVFFAFFAAFMIAACGSNAFSQKIKGGQYKTVAHVNAADFDATELRILALVNAERTRRGLSQLVFDDKIADIARDYSKKMAKENFFSHYDADGNSVVERAKAARLKHWSKIGENLFSVENLDPFDAFAVKNWMKSPAHRQNILDRDWTATGIGIAKSKSGEIYITQVFIKR